MDDYTYWAFISYSHSDEKWGKWLHRALETELLIEVLRTGIVGVPFDFEVGPLRIGLDLVDQLIDLRPRLVRQFGLA